MYKYDLYQICDKKANQVKEYLAEILHIPLYEIFVYEQLDIISPPLKRMVVIFNEYVYSIRECDFYEAPIDFIVKDIISRYTTYIIDRINETNKEKDNGM